MVSYPKYDNDLVNKGYVDKLLNNQENDTNKKIESIPKSYSAPPTTPYYKDSLLSYSNKLYKCKYDKLIGDFNWNDWEVVATDDTAFNTFVSGTYSLDKLELQTQIDEKTETWYQEIDPSLEWNTDLLKAKHVGDYWYRTSDNTQWRYSRIMTNPITYNWSQVDVPLSVYNQINGKKSIYTSKPSSYKQNDLWIIEESILDDDLPPGEIDNPVAKGDWVFALQDSDTYDKTHWIKRDEDVSISYLEEHYYTKKVIDETFTTESEVNSSIKKAKDEIELNVSSTYTTKKETTEIIKDFDDEVGRIDSTLETHGESITNLSLEDGRIKQTIESTKTEVTNGYTTAISNAKSELSQTDNEIKAEVAKKVNDTDLTGAELILRINNDSSEALLNAGKINLTASDVINLLAGNSINLTSKNISINSTNFSVDENGVIRAISGTIGGFNLGNVSFTAALSFDKTYTSEDLTRIQNIILENISPTDEDYEKYDLNHSGTINSLDLLIISKIVRGEITGNGTFQLNTSESEDAITMTRDDGKQTVNMGLFGSYLENLQTNAFVANTIECTNKVTCETLESGNIDCGTNNVNSDSYTTIYFNKTFSVPPKVICTPFTSTIGTIAIKVTEITTTYFTAVIGGSGYGSGVDFNWIAIS